MENIVVVHEYRETSFLRLSDYVDAHARAFAAFGGVAQRGVYDNMKTAVDGVLAGKKRKITHQPGNSERFVNLLDKTE
jgi:transposase